jgi:hypothetical protein
MAQIILDSSNNLIQGDFDNATVNNRTKFKTTTTDATTNVYAVPNGSATSAGFSVSNAADPTNASKITIATNGSTDTQIISGINGTGSYLPLSFYTNNALAMQVATSGNVGIGISSPSYPLEVRGSNPTNGQVLRIRNNTASGNGAQIAFDLNSVAAASVGIPNNTSALAFYVNNDTTERMRIDSSGFLCINTNANFGSGYMNILFDSSSQYGQNIKSSSTTFAGGFIRFLNSVGTVAGQIIQNGTTTVAYNTSSDYRLKENIVPMIGALATVAQLKPVTYTWKADGSNGQGFIAHELQAVVPDCVTGEKDAVETYTDEEGNEQTRIKPQGIDTSFLVATLTAAIQEQQTIINELKTRIEALESK